MRRFWCAQLGKHLKIRKAGFSYTVFLAKMRSTTLLIVLVVVSLNVLTTKGDFPQLHRALPGANGKPGYRVLSPGTTRETTGDTDSQDKHDHTIDKLNKSRKRHRTMDVAADRSTTVFYSLVSAALVGLSGIFPLLVIPLQAGPSLKHGGMPIHYLVI